MMQCGR
jgi:hypothetical protein